MISERCHAVRYAECGHRDDRSKRREQQSIVEVQVKYATDRKNPGEVEVEHHDTVEEPLVDVGKCDVCHGRKLLEGIFTQGCRWS